MRFYNAPVTNSRPSIILGWIAGVVGFASLILLFGFTAAIFIGAPYDFVLGGVILIAPLLGLAWIASFTLIPRIPSTRRDYSDFVRNNIRKPGLYVTFAILIAIYITLFGITRTWSAAPWGEPMLYVNLAPYGFVMVLLAFPYSWLFRVQFKILMFVFRHTCEWNHGVWASWRELDFTNENEGEKLFKRWPDPRNKPMTKAAAAKLMSSSQENVIRSHMFGQLLGLVSGAGLGVAISQAIQEGADLQLTTEIFAGTCVIAGIFSIYLIFRLAPRWQLRADAYKERLESIESESDRTRPRTLWKRLRNLIGRE